MSNIQTAVIAAITQLVSLIVAFGVINNTEAGVVIAASTAVVNAAVVIADAIIQHGQAKVEAAKITAGT